MSYIVVRESDLSPYLSAETRISPVWTSARTDAETFSDVDAARAAAEVAADHAFVEVA